MLADRTPEFRIGFVLFPGLTQLDLTGPWEVLTRLPGAVCELVAHSLAPVRSSSGGLAIVPTVTFAECEQLDMICVPGGPGHLLAMEDAEVFGFLARQAPGCLYVTSVCTGSLVLAAAGLLRGYRATSHWISLSRLAQFGAIPVAERVVIDRNRITGGGVTAGIDFALAVLADLGGDDLAQSLQLGLEYAPAPPFDAGTPDTAPPAILAAYNQRMAAILPIREAEARQAAALMEPAR